MAELKTQKTDASVEAFLASVPDKQRADADALVEMMQSVTGEPPKMWGPSIIGFGSIHYVYESGREGDWFVTGFSPRKQNLSLYVLCGFEGQDKLLSQLGKFKTGKSCLYVKHLDDIHLPTLKKLIRASVKQVRKTNKLC